MAPAQDPVDFPAAHSMDSTWYAVDEDGFVAEFETGEAGALPHAAAAGGEASNFDDELLITLVAARRLAAGERLEDAGDEIDLPQAPQPIVVVMEPDPGGETGYREPAGPTYSAEVLLADASPIVIREHDPRIVLARKRVKPSRIAEVARHPRVRRVLTADALRDDDGDRSVAHGMFHFGNDDYDAPGSYVRDSAPARPIRLEDLPEELRRHVGKLRLPVHFTEAPEIDLNDYLSDGEVEVWGGGSMRSSAEPPEAAVSPAPPPRPLARFSKRALAAAAVALVVIIVVLVLTSMP